MKIFGKSLSEYLGFEKGFLILVLAVGVARVILSLAGVPNTTVKFLSMTVLLLLGLIYYSVRVHTTGFGSYKQLLPVLALPVILTNLIVVAGIVTSIATGKDNIYSAPEFSPGKMEGNTWGHAFSHVVAMIVISFIFWGIGSLIMLLTKKLTGGRQPRTGTAGA
jgi:hypothetical protein